MSPRFAFDFADLKKLGKGALISGAGAAVAALAVSLAKTDLGIWGPVIGFVVSNVANALQRYASNNAPVEGSK